MSEPRDTPAKRLDVSTTRRRDLIVAASCGVFAAGMVGAAYAAVPFYNWFCRVTGFNGTTQVAEKAPGEVLDRKITVRFDSNVAGGLPWKFEPERTSIEVKLGEVVTVIYNVTNESARETTGQAGYNVAPLTVGSYFQKINCFCFTEQTLKPGEHREMPVVFYVDPALVKSSDDADTDTITLSYTFYPVRAPVRPVAASSDGAKAGRI
jgi:cytochrome c oxidase assembly protein subunit 11